MGLLSCSKGVPRLLPILFLLAHVYISLVTAESRPAAHQSTDLSTAAAHTYNGPGLLKPRATSRSFTIADHGDMFLKDQTPFRLISGSIHYHRWGGDAATLVQQQHQPAPTLYKASSLSRETGPQILTAEQAGACCCLLQQKHEQWLHHITHRTSWPTNPHPQLTPSPPLLVVPRIPPAYWEDRLARVKAMGCNAIQMYVPWNWHQPTPEPLGPHSWSGWRNITHFIQMAGDMGLLVLLRPGPYVCAGE